MTRFTTVIVLVTLLVATCIAAHADVKLPSIFSDNMVLQRNIIMPVWGTASPYEPITVEFGKQKAVTAAGKDGRWHVSLAPMKAGGPYEMVVTGKNKLTVHNILVGEVWLCAGQSNMVMQVKQCDNAEKEIAGAKDYPEIRSYTVELKASPEPQSDTVGKWEVSSPETVGRFTATGYFFAREIHDSLKVPVGIILSAWGGSNMEAFMRPEELAAHPVEAAPYYKLWEERKAAFPAEHEAALKAAAEAKAAGKPAPKMRTLEGHQARPGSIYNAMVHPLIPYGMRGVLWAGGKANRGRALEYATLMPAMIKDWRKSWGLGDFPFFICQMANWVSKDPNEHWEELRESMLKTTALKNTGLVVDIDIGDPNNVHFKNKQEVARRFALQAKSKAYGMDVVADGPIYTSMAVEGSAIRLRFKSLGGGLAARDGGPLKGFTIAGAPLLTKEQSTRTPLLDKEGLGEVPQFVPAEAVIDGDTIVVKSAKVASPVAVRYAWEMNPDCNLINKAGLPASPFRTDSWPYWQGVHSQGTPNAEE